MAVAIEGRWSDKYGRTIYFLTKTGFPHQLILSAEEVAAIADFADENNL